MAILEELRQFTKWKDNKTAVEAEEAAKEADLEYLKIQLEKYIPSESLVQTLLPAFEYLSQQNEEYVDNLFDVLKFKEEEIERAVSHKQAFEDQSTADNEEEIDTEKDFQTEEDVDWVDKILSERHNLNQ